MLVSKKRLVLRALKEIKESTESLELKQLVRVTMPYLTRIEERVSVEELEGRQRLRFCCQNFIFIFAFFLTNRIVISPRMSLTRPCIFIGPAFPE